MDIIQRVTYFKSKLVSDKQARQKRDIWLGFSTYMAICLLSFLYHYLSTRHCPPAFFELCCLLGRRIAQGNNISGAVRLRLGLWMTALKFIYHFSPKCGLQFVFWKLFIFAFWPVCIWCISANITAYSLCIWILCSNLKGFKYMHLQKTIHTTRWQRILHLMGMLILSA